MEALKLWPEYRNQLDLLITDLVMPGGMTGKQLARQLRDDQPGVRIIYYSGYSVESAGREFSPADGEGFLQKRFSSDQLLEITRRFLNSGSQLSK